MKRTVSQLKREKIREYDIESFFLYLTYNCGLRQQSYPPIVASGPNGALLHYTKNTRIVKSGDLILIDAAAESGSYGGYGSDITRTYPADGIFTPDQTLVYNIVLNTQKTIISMLKDGLNWSLALTQLEVTITNELSQAGFIQGDIPAMINDKIYQVFLPHDITHYVGLDVHDAHVRLTSNTTLKSGMVITIEPGVYFNNALLDLAFKNETQSKYLVKDTIARFANFGGVRIEDDLLITPTGYEDLSIVPKEISDIEKTMAI